MSNRENVIVRGDVRSFERVNISYTRTDVRICVWVHKTNNLYICTSLRDVAHDGVSCTFSNDQPGQAIRIGGMERPSRTNHTLLGHTPPASQAGRRVGPAL